MSTGKITKSRAIPATRRVAIHDAAMMPQDYSTSVGGTLFSTTPGGTRIIYDRKFLLQCRTSPLAHTPPTGLPDIPGVTSPVRANNAPSDSAHIKPPRIPAPNADHSSKANESAGEDDQFEMDI